MRINKIELYNIGSYEGKNVFDISAQNNKGKIVLVGGKNGAGKTTLFTGIKLCLYGYRESGYQAINAFYKKQIKKLINDKAKIEDNGQAYVTLDMSIHNGQDWDVFVLKRFWSLKDEQFELFQVWKNDIELNVEEISDFENYLLNLIPPELFELYFFDGEQIADYFLENAGNERIKQAFLTLCGYDVFDILYKNFKRINKGKESEDDALMSYLTAEDELYKAEKACKQCSEELDTVVNEIEIKSSDLHALEQQYAISGGVSLAEWNQKFLELKEEERFREEKNAWLKMAANEIIPFLIVKEQLYALQQLMEQEREWEQLEAAKEVLKEMLPSILIDLKQDKNLADQICGMLEKRIQGETQFETILNLSKDEYAKLSRVIGVLLDNKKETIIQVREEIKHSKDKSKAIREIIDNSNVEDFDIFLKQKESLINEREELISKRDQLTTTLAELLNKKAEAEATYKRISKELDKQFKMQSVNNLSTKAIVFLDELQRRLFASEIEKVQELFMFKMNQLMRKEQFIDCIKIDEDFNIHVYKRVLIDCGGVAKKITTLTPAGYYKEYGEIHCKDVLSASECSDLNEFVEKYKESSLELDVMIEFDKSTMSKGEKQVFIMSLYWAMMKLCNKEIPFIIDTPFARIDTEHRAHITEHFFKGLSEQVFIFSTDEEITEEHVNVIGNDLQAKFLIENLDNKKTTIEANKYFGD